MNWIEVSLVVESEIAEAVAEVLARFAPNGIVIESINIEDQIENEGKPSGPLRVCAYLSAEEATPETLKKIDESFWYLGRIQPIPNPQFKRIQEENWSEAWKSHYKPLPVGKGFIIVPSWLEVPDISRIPIRIDPGPAFGTGTHPTTQLSLELLESYTPKKKDIIDVGCGSGILSIAAIKLGAKRALGVDIDPEAISVALTNAKLNGVEDQIAFTTSSLNDIRYGLLEMQQAPLVAANILAHILMRLLDEGLSELITPRGILILSGILEEQVPDFQSKIKAHNLDIIDQRQKEDWVAFAVRNKL